MKTAIQIDFTFDQVLSLVRQLPKQQKLKLTKELERDIVESKLSRLLRTFKTDELSLDIIDKEAESVRQEIYEKQKR